MAQELEGRYKAKVCSVDLGIVGAKESVLLSVFFKPSAELVGASWTAGEFNKVKKAYFLSDKIIASGKSAGKTSIEYTRQQIKEAYGYEGPLELEALKAGLMDRDVELQCKPDGKGYTEVEFVNAPGGRGMKKLKDVPEDKLAKLAALWSGNAVVEKAIDPAMLFAAMKEGAA